MVPSNGREDQELVVANQGVGFLDRGSATLGAVLSSFVDFYRNRILVAFIVTLSSALVLHGAITNGLGFSDKTAWNWLDVLIFPVVLVIGGLWYDRTETQRDRKREQDQEKRDAEHAQRQRRREELAIEKNTQAAALRAYLDQMSDLLVNQKLRECPREGVVCRLAQARTLTILLELDETRKRHPLKLIAQLDLIDRGAPILSLKNAGLDGADLSEVTLIDVSLAEADLRRANLAGANLRGSDLSWADLRGADLRRAILTNASLRNANLIPYDHVNPAQLNALHLLNGSDPSDLGSATQTLSSRLDGANLEGADLTGAFLYRVNLTGTQLRRSVLADADLRGADLTEADLTEADLGDARYDAETSWPQDFDSEASGAVLVSSQGNTRPPENGREKRHER